jgi:hypothetical protein
MTHSILPSDIELAKRLLTASRPDSTIVAALVQRGVDSANATQLVTDLRSGRQVVPEIPAGLEMASRRRSRSRRNANPSEPHQSTPAPETHAKPGRAVERHADARKNSSTLWLLAAVPICFVAVIIGVLISNHRRRAEEEPQPNKSQPAASVPAAKPVAPKDQKAPSASSPVQSPTGKTATGVAQLPAAGTSNAPAPQPH